MKNKDREDIWILSSRTIQIVIPVAIKNILIMVHQFIKILTELHLKKISLSYRIYKEKEAILVWFDNLDRNFLLNINELKSQNNMIKIVQLKGGAVYHISKK